MKLSRIGIDLAKNVLQLHGVDRHGKTVWQRRLKRDQWLKALLEKAEPGCVIGMEACAGAHHWARALQSRGYPVRLIPPQFVKPYVKSNKNDANDAEAICEAMSRPNMRFVAVKSVEQQDIQATHRIRAELMTQRTAKANQIRGRRPHRRIDPVPVAGEFECRQLAKAAAAAGNQCGCHDLSSGQGTISSRYDRGRSTVTAAPSCGVVSFTHTVSRARLAGTGP